MPPQPSVSAVVATYNRRDDLPRFVEACLGSEGLDELVVAVDGSDDGSMELLAERARTDPRLVPLWVDHQGQFGALDAAVRAALSDVVLLLDDDVELAPATVMGHARHHRDDDRLVVLGYMPTALPTPPPRAEDFATVLYDREYEARCAIYESRPSTVLTNLWGGHLSLRRTDYLALAYQPLEPPPGGEGIRLYHQDTEFGLRCQEHGLSGRFDRSLTATHHHRRPLEGFLNDCFGRGAVSVLIADHHPSASLPEGTGTHEDLVDRMLRATVGHERLGRALSAACDASLRAAVRSRSMPVTLLAAKSARRVRLAQGAAVMESLVRADPGRTARPR
jgi:GT2 family glycosyltransferase